MEINEQEIIDGIRIADNHSITLIYRIYRGEFINYFLRYQLSEEDLKDIYQESMIILYNNIVKDKYQKQNATLKTYLFSIGKFKVIDFLRKHKKQIIPQVEDTYTEIEVETNALNSYQLKLHKHYKNLGKSCQKIIELFYYRGFSIEEIVLVENYKDANTVKAHKSRCIKQLREKIKHHG